MQNLKQKSHNGKVIFMWFKIFQKQCKEGEEKYEENWAICGSVYLVHH